ncbi:ABC-2 type transport system ATP-binding protein [Pullulanibacillus pueri]|uniref:Putative ABC transporter ATP-binding protein YhaQ n=1 Tax=Pullulanibacillus pueri TaxID=1437324 RepID=A0A8J2ZVU7_9BACL|nr:ABC transporter ATP-binding protein [Pullulanibacillus pueri]MBM7682211.1 ABC-2 type transport system ATP-binding protein [Pullulanibacillus pueri]GGH80462.1 putative ABC transporter ATP-binding protein YhaQ [Pullulanibacillus pueri]
MTLILEKVVKTFDQFTAVDHLSIEIPEKQIFGLLGANGAGKTTTFRMILDLLQPTSGRITWKGKPINYEMTNQIGYLPEERGLYPKLKVFEQMIYLGKLKGMKKPEIVKELKAWLERFGVSDYYDKKVEDLSKGNQQKIQFIAAVLHRPKLLILDEPFTGLDPVNVEVLKNAVKDLQNAGMSILFSSHRMDHVEELCENLCILHHGRPIVYGSLHEVKSNYGKKNVVIRGDFDTEDLKEIPGVTHFERDHRFTKLQIESEEKAANLFNAIKDRGFVREFQIVEPTLQEIFIDKVGEAAHE